MLDASILFSAWKFLNLSTTVCTGGCLGKLTGINSFFLRYDDLISAKSFKLISWFNPALMYKLYKKKSGANEGNVIIVYLNSFLIVCSFGFNLSRTISGKLIFSFSLNFM